VPGIASVPGTARITSPEPLEKVEVLLVTPRKRDVLPESLLDSLKTISENEPQGFRQLERYPFLSRPPLNAALEAPFISSTVPWLFWLATPELVVVPNTRIHFVVQDA
jgi:hypothetical protein